MHYLFAAARLFPYWALPLALVIGEIGVYFRRRRDKRQWIFFGISGTLVLVTFLWFGFRGDLRSDDWIRWILGRP